MASCTVTFFVLSLLCLQMTTVRTEDDQQQKTDALRPDEDLRILMKRFYAWEDAKRSFDSIYAPKAEKRKQFYAWAGKRSAGLMDKRKQFYAWAGRK